MTKLEAKNPVVAEVTYDPITYDLLNSVSLTIKGNLFGCNMYSGDITFP